MGNLHIIGSEHPGLHGKNLLVLCELQIFSIQNHPKKNQRKSPQALLYHIYTHNQKKSNKFRKVIPPQAQPISSSRCPSNPEVSRDPLLPTAEPRPRQPGSRRPRRSRGGRPTLGNQKKTGATNQYTRVCIYIYIYNI